MSKDGDVKAYVRIIGDIFDAGIDAPPVLTNYLRTLISIASNDDVDLGEIKIYSHNIREFIEGWYMSKTSSCYQWGYTTKMGVKIIYENVIKMATIIDDIQETQHITNQEKQANKSVGLSRDLGTPCVFIGHGRSKLWARLDIFLTKELGLTTISYESESRVGESIIQILGKMLNKASFAVIVLTGDDIVGANVRRARQNAIHEAGLFQGTLGFERAILLLQKGLEDFSNIQGLQHIPFPNDEIEQTFRELERVLRREKQIPPNPRLTTKDSAYHGRFQRARHEHGDAPAPLAGEDAVDQRGEPDG